jgi:hypothetical protein
MESEEPPVELFDFIYRDTSRFNSYYAQLFSGRLASIERTDSDRSSEEKSAKLNPQLATGHSQSNTETLVATKSTIDPHDVIAIEVVARLKVDNRFSSDIQSAENGSLIIANGNVSFIDRYILEVASASIDINISSERSKPRNQQDKEKINLLENTKKILPKISMPSAFLMQTEKNLQIAGTIKESGLEEPITSYYFKHGFEGISDIYLIGIKEKPSDLLSLVSTPFLQATLQMSRILSSLLFPENAIRVTPIAMFRKLK